jgi:hypothetical protein
VNPLVLVEVDDDVWVNPALILTVSGSPRATTIRLAVPGQYGPYALELDKPLGEVLGVLNRVQELI